MNNEASQKLQTAGGAEREAHDEICTDCQAHVERKKFIRCKRGAELERAVAGIDAAPMGDKRHGEAELRKAVKLK